MLEDGQIINCKQLNLDPYAELKYDKDVARVPGTGYVDTYYNIVGTDDALIEHQNVGEDNDELLHSEAEVIKGYYEAKKHYGYECARLSEAYNLPWEVCAALGINEELYPKVINCIYAFDLDNPIDLLANTEQQKQTLRNVFGTELYDAIEIEAKGPKHISILVEYLHHVFEAKDC